MDVCRICLSKNPEKDILQAQVDKNDVNKTYADIMLFCLDIKVNSQDATLYFKL